MNSKQICLLKWLNVPFRLWKVNVSLEFWWLTWHVQFFCQPANVPKQQRVAKRHLVMIITKAYLKSIRVKACTTTRWRSRDTRIKCQYKNRYIYGINYLQNCSWYINEHSLVLGFSVSLSNSSKHLNRSIYWNLTLISVPCFPDFSFGSEIKTQLIGETIE